MSDIYSDLAGQSIKYARYRYRYLQWMSVLCLLTALTFMMLDFFVWEIYGAGIGCMLYAPVCLAVIWGLRRCDGRLNLFVNIFVFATLLLMLDVIYFQRPDVAFDPWILACPTLAFALCERRVAALWGTLSALGFLSIRQIAPYPTLPGSSLSLVLAIVAISIGLYLYSSHLDDIENLIVELGNTDSLTNTLNRRSFDEILRTEFRRDLRQGTSMAVFMIDADYFKNYNDRHGHLNGDRVLVAIAGALKQSARRPGDFVFRYGGEEFCILCSGLDADQAAAFGETLRANVEALELEHRSSPSGRITISLGYRHAESLAALTPERLVEDADKALYLAKANGRNRVENYLSVSTG